MPSNTDSRDLLSTLHRLDATVSKWGYGVSGWAGVFTGALAMVAAQEAARAIDLGGAVDTLVAPVVWLVAVYGLLGAAYAYRQRYGGPACRV